MKKLFHLILALTALIFVSCVDESFDLSDLNDDNIGVGDSNSVITAPITTIELSFDEILADYTRATESYTLSEQSYEGTIELGENWMDDEFKSTINSGDSEVTLTLTCSEYPKGFPAATFEVWFDEINIFEEAQTISSENLIITTVVLDEQDIDDITAATTLTYKIYFAQQTFNCDLEDIESLEFTLSLNRTGAIKL